MSLTEEEKEFYRQENEKRNIQRQQQDAMNVDADGQAFALREAERNIISEQIDLTEIKDEVENLLRGRIIKENPKGSGITKWTDPDDPEMKVLSEHGVHLIMNTISFYLNKNTLLSNYDEDTIFVKMEDFSEALADTIFMEYEKVFEYPTELELQEKLKDRIEKKTQRRKFAYELIGRKVNEKEIKEDFIEEIEEKIEEEITKIREQIIKNKLKRFLIIMRQVQDTVHSSYLRALNGAERRTLRQHIHVSESIGGGNMFPQSQQKRSSSLNPARWFGK